MLSAFVYDAGNRRMQKDVGPSAPAGQDTDFFYSAWQLLEERNLDTSGTLRYSFVWGNYIDELLARDDGAAGRLFYHQNTLFSTYAVSDEAGDIQERYAYDPYGKVTFFDDTGTVLTASTLSVHHLFTGRELDPETGLQLNRYRYYDAGRGRWISPDPIGHRGGPNYYCAYFVPNGTDPTGFADVSLYPDNPSEGADFAYDEDLQIAISDLRIRRAKGATNSEFGKDTYNADNDQKIVTDFIVSTLCNVKEQCCNKEQCEKEAKNISEAYRESVMALRLDFIEKYGWVGKGNAGNGANWNAAGLKKLERARRKEIYYFDKQAPGPLCHEWGMSRQLLNFIFLHGLRIAF